MGLRFINPGATWLRRASRQSSNATSCTLRCWAIAPSGTKAMPLVLTRRGVASMRASARFEPVDYQPGAARA